MPGPRIPGQTVDMATKPGTTDALVRWRRKQLLEAGMPRTLASRVARDERYDLHDLIELLEHGCAPRVAVRILEPIGRDDAA